ncbi:MAG: alpha/beta hydrolase family protein [Flavobacteriales bacterium]
MKIQREIYFGANRRESLYELSSLAKHRELIVFTHGFMGFMDWGAWHLVRDFFTARGFDFCRFNLSHNGGTVSNPIDFTDEKAFGQNTYSKELEDISSLLNHLESQHRTYQKIHLIGHSRGGGMSILAAQQWQCKSHLGQICTWAAICDIERRFPKEMELEEWKRSGIRLIKNGRTGQQLPQYYSLYEDYILSKNKLDILAAAKAIGEQLHLFHGDQDTSVPISEGYELQAVSGAQLHQIQGADHVFGAQHPWAQQHLPFHLKTLCEQTLNCLQTKKASI